MNLSPRWVEALEAAGFTAKHWREIGEGNASDREVLRWARAGGWLVFTNDLDFSQVLALTGETGPSVVQIRSHDVLPDTAGAVVLDVLRRHEAALRNGAVIVIDADRSRVRLLPLR
jgi:predicted nuclease of predicted toxin-antitoxin system